MMRYFYLFLFLVLIQQSFAQVSKAFLLKNGTYSSDPKHAVGYILIQKLDGDSAYMVKQFDIRDTIVMSGFYKDGSLSVPNGKFTYYRKWSLHKNSMLLSEYKTLNSHVDTNNYIQKVGYYINGKKSGIWIEYVAKGVKQSEVMYDNDKQNGLYKIFTLNTNGWDEGTMINDVLEGKYYSYNADSILVTERDIIHGKMVNTTVHFHNAQEDPDLDNYLEKALKKYRTQIIQYLPVVKYLVDKSGKIINPQIVTGVNPEVDNAIIAALLSAPNYTPATNDGVAVAQHVVNSLFLYNALSNENMALRAEKK